jgi:hypothetical protein
MSTDHSNPSPTPPITLKEFFEAIPPGRSVQAGETTRRESNIHSNWLVLSLPELQLHCVSQECGGIRFFVASSEPRPEAGKLLQAFTRFTCKNCGNSSKTFAYRIALGKDGATADLFKFGEDPAFGPPTPARLITLLGSEREYFLKGRRAENQGLGIAAFAYYRRVLDNQRIRVLEEITRVAEKLGAAPEMLDDLRSATAEAQFSKAVESVKHGIPQALLIDGHNPLLLLHTALSEGLHAQSDEECLALATSIRVVLTELVERMALALKEEAELKGAVSKLLALKASSQAPKK